MTLHQINQLSYPTELESIWQNGLKKGDQLLLIEEGILRLSQDHSQLKSLIETKGIELLYLQSDAVAYGLTPSLGNILSDEEWVQTTFSANAIISW
ncbi:DsrH/TusB family sulfur metabolism protein [Marinomonas sp. 5E14-1]|uniref:DsrH/TusB family sulfur metabolism protein n=1 Tax=Marinomonas sp. 5E14-1 TaxID=3153922 RepID=UPI003266E9B4